MRQRPLTGLAAFQTSALAEVPTRETRGMLRDSGDRRIRRTWRWCRLSESNRRPT